MAYPFKDENATFDMFTISLLYKIGKIFKIREGKDHQNRRMEKEKKVCTE
jgi:hypothetical protein